MMATDSYIVMNKRDGYPLGFIEFQETITFPNNDSSKAEMEFVDSSKYVEAEKIKEFKSLATTWAIQIAIDTARRLYKQEHGRYPLYPSTEEEVLWIGNYAGEAMNSVVNEILGTNETYKKKIGTVCIRQNVLEGEKAE